MPTPISIRNITKEFPAIGSAGTTKAVDNISLEIETGELFFLLGPSGCGKTTLLRMIAGFIDPTAGTILFGSRDVTHLPPNQRNTGMVFQSYALWPHMTIEANVAFGLDVRKTPANEAKTRIEAALAAVRMSQYSKRKPNQLSGGQQQRIALARARRKALYADVPRVPPLLLLRQPPQVVVRVLPIRCLGAFPVPLPNIGRRSSSLIRSESAEYEYACW